MNILVTGGAGFIGSSLVKRLLDKGDKVYVIDNFNDYYDVTIKHNNVVSFLNDPNYKLYDGDIEDKESVRKVFIENKIDCVVHIAARAGVRPSILNPEAYVKTNVLGTLNILETMKEFGIKKLIFASSSSVYGNCQEEIFSEDLDVGKPISPYAATKLACEQLCYTYSTLYKIQTICFRFFTVFGPNQRPDLAISKFAALISENRSIPMFGDGSTKRDYTFIDDIVSGIVCGLSYDKTPYEIINLGGGNPVTLIEMIQSIEKHLGKKAIIERHPMQPGDVDKTMADISKAKKLLGYNPQTSFDEGVRKFVEWKKTASNISEKSGFAS